MLSFCLKILVIKMNEIEEALLHTLKVYSTALKILLLTDSLKVYSEQFDETLDKMCKCSIMVKDEVRKEWSRTKMSVKVKV